MLFKYWREKRLDILIPFILILIGMGILVLATDGSWWARYTPYLYLLPILNMLYLNSRKGIVFKTIGGILTILLITNISIIIYANVGTYKNYNLVKERYNDFIEESKQSKSLQIKLRTTGFEGIKYNIYDAIGEKDITFTKNIKGKSKYAQYFWYRAK